MAKSDYGKETKVTIPKTKAEIEEYLNLRKIKDVIFPVNSDFAGVIFKCDNALYRLSIKMPTLKDCRMTESGRWRNDKAARSALEQEEKATWRRLLLVIKAKFVMVDDNPGVDFLTEFLGYRLLPNCKTTAEECLEKFAALPAPGMEEAALSGTEEQDNV